MDMAVHHQRTVIIFTAAMAGINLCKWGKFLIVGFPVLSSGAQLISHMMGNSDHRLSFICFYQFLITHRMLLLFSIFQEKYIVVAVQPRSLPFITHKHRKSFFFSLKSQLADLLPVLLDQLIFITVLHR